MRYAKMLTATLLAAGLGLASCGSKTGDSGATGTSASAASGADFDPCGVMSGADMAAITSDAVIQLQKTDAHSCNYKSNPNDGTQIQVFLTGGKDQMEVAHNTSKLLGGMGGAVADKGGAGADTANLLKPDPNAVPKIGDEAMWEPNATLAVRKGDVFVEVSPPIMHDPANHKGYPIVPVEEKRAIALKVATALLAKLGQ